MCEEGQILGAGSLGYLGQGKELRFQELQPNPGSPAPPISAQPIVSLAQERGSEGV